MAEPRIDVLLGVLDRPEEPDPLFREALFAELAPRALRAARRDRTAIGRFVAALRGLGAVRPTLGDPVLRPALVVALLTILALAVLALAGALRPDPRAIVEASQQRYAELPAFDMTVAYADGDERRFRYDGAGRLRTDLVAGEWESFAEGSWMIDDTTTGFAVEHRADHGTGLVVPIGTSLGPAPRLDLRWGKTWQRAAVRGYDGSDAHPCKRWEIVGASTIVGRPVDWLRCVEQPPGRGTDVWIDRETRLVLATTDVPAGPYYADRVRGEVTALALDAPLSGELFRIPEGEGRWGRPLEGGDRLLVAGVTYSSTTFEFPFTVRPGDGWRSWGTGVDVVGFVRGPRDNDDDWAGVWLLRLDRVTDPVSGIDVALAPGSGAVLAWITSHPYYETGIVEPIEVVGLAGSRVATRETLPAHFDASCPPPAPDAQAQPEPCRRMFPNGTGYWSYGATHDASFIGAIDTPSGTVTVIALMNGDVGSYRTAIDDLLATVEFAE